MNKLIGLVFVALFSANISSLTASNWDWNFKKLIPEKWINTQPKGADLSYESLHNDTIGGVAGEEIKIFMLRHAGRMKASDKEALVSVFRKGEILKIAVPCEQLFLPNDTLLDSCAEQKLYPMLTFMRKGLTNMIIVGYTDNTGRKDYVKQLSVQRANAVADWFSEKGVSEKNMGVYAFGDENPIFENNTMLNRAKNRRVVIYLVPNQKMIKLAKKKELNTNS